MKHIGGQHCVVIVAQGFIGGIHLAQRGDETAVAQFLQPQQFVILGRTIGAGLLRLDHGD